VQTPWRRSAAPLRAVVGFPLSANQQVAPFKLAQAQAGGSTHSKVERGRIMKRRVFNVLFLCIGHSTRRRSFIFSRCRRSVAERRAQAGVLSFEFVDAVFQLLNGCGDISGIELLRDMLGAVHVPGFNREQDRLLSSRVVTFWHEPPEQLRIVRDDASSTPDFDPPPLRVVHEKQESAGRAPYELLQNADDVDDRFDCSTTDAAFFLFDDGLAFAHNGPWFTVRDFIDLTLSFSTKEAGECIGYKGIGFRSTLDVTPNPRIYRIGADKAELSGFEFCLQESKALLRQTIEKHPGLEREWVACLPSAQQFRGRVRH